MPQVKVWNDNDYDHREKFKGKDFFIAAGEALEMDFEEAIEFKGQFTPIVLGKGGQPDPRHYKKIRVEWPKEPAVKADPLVCHADGVQMGSDAALRARLEQFSHLLVKDEAAEKEVAARRAQYADRIEAMEARIAELTAKLADQAEKRGPGRPRKESA